MPIDTGNKLAGFSKNRVGDSLRTVVVLYENDFETLYLDDRLKNGYSAEEYSDVVDSFRIDLSQTFHNTSNSRIGQKDCLVHSHEDAYVFQFPHEDCHSILLSVNPDVGPDLRSFIEQCREQI